MAARRDYDADSIQWFRGLEGVRKKPAMYIGETGNRGMTHLVKEIIGNAIDEASNGHASAISIYITKDDTVTIADNGRGIPVGPHPKDRNRDTLTIIATELHSGGKMDADSGNYKTALGTHGLGMAVVNACSAVMVVCSYRNKVWNCQTFKAGRPETAKPQKQAKLPDIGADDNRRGTVVMFKPDPKVFDKGARIDRKALLSWVDEMAWLVPSRFTVEFEGRDPVTVHRKDGLAQRFERECKKADVEPLPDVPVFVLQNEHVDVMIGWAGMSESNIMSSVSGSRTSHHGTHVQGFNRALKDAFEIMRTRSDSFTADSLATGMIAVVNVKVPAPKFSSQDKVKLVSPEGAELMASAMAEEFAPWVKKHKSALRAVVDRANEIARLSSEFKANAKLAAAVKTSSRGKSLLPPSLAASTTRNPNERELYIVEGQSAGGSAKAARDPKYQEILPLTGKPPNAYKHDDDKLMSNARILEVLKSIGYNPKDPTSFRVGKVILLADADDDGTHIEALALTALLRFTPKLLEQGRVYVVDAPLYFYATEGKEPISGASPKEIQARVGARFNPERMTRVKGWGEANASDLRRVAFDPATREMFQVTLDSGAKRLAQMQRVVALMGEGTEARKALLGI